MNEEMKKFMDKTLVMNVSEGKMIFSKKIPEVFRVRIKTIRTNKQYPKNVEAIISISSQSSQFKKNKDANMIINTNNLSTKEKEYVKTHTKDEMINWFGSIFMKDFPMYLKRLVKIHVRCDECDQIFFEPDKFDQFINMIADAAYYCNNMQNDES